MQLLGSGTILREVLAAADLLEQDFGRAAGRVERDLVHRAAPRRDRGRALEHAAPRCESRGAAYVTEQPGGPARPGHRLDRLHARGARSDPPVGARRRYRVLGTDGYGRSDYRRALRRFFEVDRHYVAVAALQALADWRARPRSSSQQAIERYEIDPDAPMPTTV